MKKTVVTIGISAYNSNEMLTKCLNSMSDLINNSKIEIILVDDGSNNKQINYVPQQFINAKNFKYHYKQNEGLSSSRNYIINNAIGQYLVFVDADDWFIEKKFIEIINKIEKYTINKKIDLFKVFFKTDNVQTILFSEDKYYNSVNKYIIDNFLIKFSYWSSWSHIYSKDFLINNKLFFNNFLAEDLEHLIRTYDRIQNIYTLNDIYYYYNKNNPNSITRERENEMKKCVETFINNYEFNNDLIYLIALIGLKSLNIRNFHGNKINIIFIKIILFSSNIPKFKKIQFIKNYFKKKIQSFFLIKNKEP